MTRFTTAAVLALGVVLGSGTAVADTDRANMGPAEVIEYTARLALDELDRRRDEFRRDSAALHAAVDELLMPVFDVQRAGDLVLGRHARDASVDQRRRFARALYQSLMRQYAEIALDFSPDRLVVRPVRGEPDPRRTRVDSEVQLDDGSRVAIAYMLRETNDGWKVFDVVAEGISYIRNFREQYDSEIRRLGLDEVIARLERAAASGEHDDILPDIGDGNGSSS